MAKPSFRILCTALVALMLALYAWLGWSATLEKGPAFDESAHLTAGYSYWKFNDYRLQPENGNLPQRWAGLAVTPLSPTLEPSARPELWAASDVWNIGQDFLFAEGNPLELMLATGRGAMILWGVACGLLVFAWSRRLWGTPGALLSLALCAGSATMLAHGPMITSDMTAAFCLLGASGAFWRYLERPGFTRLVISLLMTGLTAIAKFSFVLLVPIYAILLAWNWNTFTRSFATTSASRLSAIITGLRVTGLVIAHALAAVVIVWAAFGFRYSADAGGMPVNASFYIPWDNLLPASGLKRELLVTLKDYRLLPEAYTHGFAYVLQASEARGAFAAGQVSTTGWWWFFPYAFLLKSTLAELMVVAALMIMAARRWLFSGGSKRLPSDLKAIAPLVALTLVYGGASILSNLNIGHRHILPLYLPLFIMAGALLRPGTGKKALTAAIALVVVNTIESVRAYPNYIAYFNPIAGPADQRWNHLVDSSLDWGQELPALASWLKTNRQGDEQVFLSYFGVADPRREGMRVVQFAPYSSQWHAPHLAKLTPGLYCISATLLQDSYSPLNGPWTHKLEATFHPLSQYFGDHPEELDDPKAFALFKGTWDEKRRWLFERARFARLAQYLRVRRPDAIINSAMLVYRLDQREVSLAVDAPTFVFQQMIEKAFADTNSIKAAP
ncbi:MAG TPA: glycosyltransferase family 39 protein [Rariglobus sp.]|nr:glycosyltransferase family 39 protein [Rariglobus sp.]